MAVERLMRLGTEARRRVIQMAARSRSPHVGSCLSCVDILVTLYFDALRIDKCDWEERDLFVLSKAHAAMSLYAILSLKGAMSDEDIRGYFVDGGTLPAHLDRTTSRWIESSAGSLGHGFSIAIGLALAQKLRRTARRVYVLIGDGEAQEGAIWEGAIFAPRLGLDNLTAVMDVNNLQGYGRPTELCAFEPMAEKWRAFGWHAVRVNGHDYTALRGALRQDPKGKPKMIIADTVKGKGVSFMEHELKWHYYIVTEALARQALEELEAKHAR